MKRVLCFWLGIVFCFALSACSSYYEHEPDNFDDVSFDNENNGFFADDTTTTTAYIDDVQYISDRSVQYNDADKDYTVFFGLKNSNKEYIDSSGIAEIIVYEEEGEKKIYSTKIEFTQNDFTSWTNASWDSSRYLCGLYFERKNIAHQNSSRGVLSLQVTLDDGTYFSADRMSIYDLPTHDWDSATCTTPKKCSSCGKTEGSAEGHDFGYSGECYRCGKMNPEIDKALAKCSLSLPELPKTIKEFGYNDETISSVSVTNISYEFEYSSSDGYIELSIYLSGKKMYDREGTGQSRECKIGWKLYDANGAVIKTGTFYSPSVDQGESFANQEEQILYSFDKVKPGTFRLEILNVN